MAAVPRSQEPPGFAGDLTQEGESLIERLHGVMRAIDAAPTTSLDLSDGGRPAGAGRVGGASPGAQGREGRLSAPRISSVSSP
jgi:DNA-binding transcriptional LysR family regulator